VPLSPRAGGGRERLHGLSPTCTPARQPGIVANLGNWQFALHLYDYAPHNAWQGGGREHFAADLLGGGQRLLNSVHFGSTEPEKMTTGRREPLTNNRCYTLSVLLISSTDNELPSTFPPCSFVQVPWECAPQPPLSAHDDGASAAAACTAAPLPNVACIAFEIVHCARLHRQKGIRVHVRRLLEPSTAGKCLVSPARHPLAWLKARHI